VDDHALAERDAGRKRRLGEHAVARVGEQAVEAGGAITAGSALSVPNSGTDSARCDTSTRVRGSNRMSSRARRLRASVSSSSAPPSRYSRQKFGSRRAAIARSSAMPCARAGSLPPYKRRRGAPASGRFDGFIMRL